MKSALQSVVEDFAKDSVKETKGVWMTYKRNEFLIARAHRNNKAFLALMEERMRPYQWAIDRGNFAALKEVAQDVMQAVYAETVLLGVRNATSKEVLDYAPADGVELFQKLPDFWDEVFKFSGSDSPYSPDAIKDDSKN